MFQHIEQKVDDAVLSFVIVGLISVLLGVLIITNEFLLRFITGAFLFVFAYLMFHLSYKLNSIKMAIQDKVPFLHHDGDTEKRRKK